MARFEAFWRTMCAYRSYIWLAVMVHIFLLLLAIFGLVVGQPGTASYTLSIVNVGLLTVSGGTAFLVFYTCTRREGEEY
ncbi:hypothetical protein [Halomicrobium katesii]|uniref:hypothetical protein n=1 Tax=Halomicrobium katesii TaxID=437163 RepID=UPI0005D17DE8|nr:hypothetical protein [Halomicrobium katesii]